MAFTVVPAELAVLDEDEFVLGEEGEGAFVAWRWAPVDLGVAWSVDSFATHSYVLSVLVTCGALDSGGDVIIIM